MNKEQYLSVLRNLYTKLQAETMTRYAKAGILNEIEKEKRILSLASGENNAQMLGVTKQEEAFTKPASIVDCASWDIADTGYDASNPYRNSEAFYFLPTDDEWVKAAYWNGISLQSDATRAGETFHKGDGVSGTGWNYDLAPPIGPWDVGSGSEELNGTFDMMGNVWEWMESPYHIGDYLSASQRATRGRGYYLDFYYAHKLYGRYFFGASNENHVLGFRVASVSEQSTPPDANANGPYTIYVGDTLTLDANGSTDADGDIVSYEWDLDGDVDGVFETDAGGQAVFGVDYSYLEGLGLLVDVVYDIRLKVTDSDAQSDIAYTMLEIVPKPALQVAVDIRPTSCPTPLNVKSRGVLPVAILGSEDVNVTEIDVATILLEGVSPIRSALEDVATPVTDVNDCNCTTDGPDGFLDLTLKFETQRIVEAIGDVNHGDILTLMLTGVLFDETPIEGADCILIRGRHKPFNKADINKDGVVDTVDFNIFAKNWLQSSIIDD